MKPEKIKMNHKYKSRLLGLFLLRSQEDFFDCKISSLLSRLSRSHHCKTERMQSRVQQMNIISQRDKHGDKFKSS